MNGQHLRPDEKDLRDALRVLAHEERGLGARPDVEERVMRAWDTRPARAGAWRRVLLTPGAGLALAASVVAASWAGYWWTGQSAEPPSSRPESLAPSIPEASRSLAYETLGWLEPDPASIHIVRLRVASAALEAQGYSVTDPDGDGTVEVEMIVGADGTAWSVQVAPTTGSSY